MLMSLMLISLPALLSPAPARADLNDQTSLVMHAVETEFGPCAIDDPCPGPTVTVPTSVTIAAYLLIRHYDEVAGVQTAFDWNGWVFLFGLWDCQSNQVNGFAPTAPGPSDGTIATAFDCVTGGASAVIGRLHLVTATPGCIQQVTSSFPFGTHVVSCGGQVHEIDPDCWGSICAPDGGYDACEPCQLPTAVVPTSWGTIKVYYRK
jgi:hypothetical protein